jgi:spore maturation protein CgeB
MQTDNKKYRIAVLGTTKEQSLINRMSFFRALVSLGNEVRLFSVFIEKRIREYNPDFLLICCVYYGGMRVRGVDNILADFPYITLWDSNPLSLLHYLKDYRENHIGLLMIDTQVVEDLRTIGFKQAEYFPYYYTDLNIFKPLPSEPKYSHDVSFAGTFVHPSLIPSIFKDTGTKIEWTDTLGLLRNNFEKERSQRYSYIDVFEYLNEKIDIWSKEFVELSRHFMFLQKWIERSQLFESLSESNIEIHMYGGMKSSYMGGNFNARIKHKIPNLHIHDFLDKHTELPKLYNSSKINLCCTQFPRACHERVFQTAACGAFILHEYKEDASALFEPGKEIVMYKKLEELPDLIKYYLKNEDERKKIAANARKRFLSEHTPLHRAKKFMEIVGEKYRV